MSELSSAAAAIFKRGVGRERLIVAIAGPPAAGKSTTAEKLAALLPEGTATVVPMDGFHYDDGVLDRMGLRQRKGAPETFDLGGYISLIRRLRAREHNVAIPIFDRTMELARGSAALVPQDIKFIITEGNYLLLDEAPWTDLAPLFDVTVYLDVSRDELERRLVQRWLEHGRTPEAGRAWIDSNDMPNIDRVLTRRRPADLTL
jgi:pantothenate kinase